MGHALTRRWFQPVAMLLACGLWRCCSIGPSVHRSWSKCFRALRCP